MTSKQDEPSLVDSRRDKSHTVAKQAVCCQQAQPMCQSTDIAGPKVPLYDTSIIAHRRITPTYKYGICGAWKSSKKKRREEINVLHVRVVRLLRLRKSDILEKNPAPKPARQQQLQPKQQAA